MSKTRRKIDAVLKAKIALEGSDHLGTPRPARRRPKGLNGIARLALAAFLSYRYGAWCLSGWLSLR